MSKFSNNKQLTNNRQHKIGGHEKQPFDVFISHASEDKNEIVRPLALCLKNLGLRVWYDEFSLKAGDSLRRSIDYGLKNSRYGVVVLSPNFFTKNWAQWELNGLVSRQIAGGGKSIIIPVWHNIGSREVIEHSPSLADIVAIKSSIGPENIAKEICRIIQTNDEIDDAHISQSDITPNSQLIYVGEIKGIEGDAADEIRLHIMLLDDTQYIFYNDGCGPYGYSCGVPFGRVFSNRIFAMCYFRRISDMPLNHRLYGGPRLIADNKLLTWKDVKDTRVDNIHFALCVDSKEKFDFVVAYFQKILAKEPRSGEEV